MDEQIKLFSETGYLAAIHGAGMTNMIYRSGSPLSVLELHGDSYVSRDFKQICSELGYRFERIVGRSAGNDHYQKSDFYVDCDYLVQKLSSMQKGSDRAKLMFSPLECKVANFGEKTGFSL